jgi:type IV pilus assembly protein PilA
MQAKHSRHKFCKIFNHWTEKYFFLSIFNWRDIILKNVAKSLQNKDNEKGFTLIELMIVVAIIGILAALAIPLLDMYRGKAFNAAAASDVRTIKTALEAYYSDHQVYISNI